MKRISIDPVTRLEGHGRIEIFLNEAGEVANVYFQVPELRGFERFCVGRQVEELPAIMNRICGVCPEAHHLAATKALDQIFNVEPPPTARKLRELLYMAFFVTDHTTHFYALGGPDFIVGPSAPPAERNLLGVIHKVGLDVGKQVIACRARNHHVIEMLGGRGIHLAAGLPGGWSRSIVETERAEIEAIARQNIEFAQFTLQVFAKVVLGNSAYHTMIFGDNYVHRTYSMGTVDEHNRANFYDGLIRVVDLEGAEVLKYPAQDYALHLAEHVEPWTFLKFPYLRKIGWKGMVDGADSGVYVATPLSRLNVSDSLATPRAQEAFEAFFDGCGSRKVNGRYLPVHHRLATHWARLVETLYASERMLELATDPDICCPDVRVIPDGRVRPEGGVGSVEAPRGTLTHHYVTDENAVVTKVNLLVGTTNNYAAMSMTLKRAAQGLIRAGEVISDDLLNQVEMGFRLYDPCLSCATHALPGRMPMVVTLRDPAGQPVQILRRD